MFEVQPSWRSQRSSSEPFSLHQRTPLQERKLNALTSHYVQHHADGYKNKCVHCALYAHSVAHWHRKPWLRNLSGCSSRKNEEASSRTYPLQWPPNPPGRPRLDPPGCCILAAGASRDVSLATVTGWVAQEWPLSPITSVISGPHDTNFTPLM